MEKKYTELVDYIITRRNLCQRWLEESSTTALGSIYLDEVTVFNDLLQFAGVMTAEEKFELWKDNMKYVYGRNEG